MLTLRFFSNLMLRIINYMEGSGMRSKSKLLAGIATTAVAVAMSSSAFAQKNINLTAIDGYPPKASWVREFIKYYIPAINKRLAATGNYKISWNQAWSGQIVKTKHVLARHGIPFGLPAPRNRPTTTG